MSNQSFLRALPSLLTGAGFVSLVLYLILLGGIAMTFIQYFFNRDLWLDEAMLANNIVQRSFGGLFSPLADNQVAPIGYLLLNKLLISAFGVSSYSLRIVSLLAYLIAIPLLGQLVRIHTRKAILPVLAMALFSATYSMIYYATEVKQYALEVLVFLLLLRYLITERPVDQRWLITYALLGALCCWFSHTAAIPAFVCGSYLLWQAVKHSRFILLWIPATWAASAVLYYFLFLYQHPATEYMQAYWQDSFLTVSHAPSFLFHAVKDIFSETLGFRMFWTTGALLATSGLIFLLKEKKYLLLHLCCTPVIVHLILSVLHLYPFEGRLTVYLVPAWWILVSAGVYGLCSFVAQKFGHPLLILMGLPACILSYATTKRIPVEREEITPHIARLEKNKLPEEKVWVYYSTIHALDFYETTGKSHLAIDTIASVKSRDARENYHEALLSLRGRAWLLFSHVYDRKNTDNEQTYIVRFMESRGARILEEYTETGSALFYIDTGKPQE